MKKNAILIILIWPSG